MDISSGSTVTHTLRYNATYLLFVKPGLDSQGSEFYVIGTTGKIYWINKVCNGNICTVTASGLVLKMYNSTANTINIYCLGSRRDTD